MSRSDETHSLRSLINQQPRLVRVAQMVVMPLSILFFSALGAWWFFQGRTGASIVALILGASGPVSFALYYALYVGGTRAARKREVRKSISLSAAGSPALEVVTEVLQAFAPDSVPEIDSEHLVVSTVLPRSSKSYGERITVRIQSVESGQAATAEVASYCVRPQILDHGKNRANVEAVIDALRVHEN